MWIIIVTLLGYLVAVFLVNLKILFYYEHPDDSKYNQGIVAKAISILGLELAWLFVAILPTDAFNALHNGGLDSELLWHFVYFFTLLFLIFPIPFAVFFYESDTDPRISKAPAWIRSLKNSLIVFVVCGLLITILYFALRSSSIQVCNDLPNGRPECRDKAVKIPFFSFGAILLPFCGWFLVLIYLGFGLTALPLGLIFGFLDRPQPISQQEYSNAKIKLVELITGLKQVGETLREQENQIKRKPNGFQKFRANRAYKHDFNKFRQSVHLLDNEYEALNVSLKERGENPLLSYAKLACGIFSVLLSILWFMHIIIYILLPQLMSGRVLFRGLDAMLAGSTKAGVFLLDLVLYLILVGYLLTCVMVGCFRFNMRMFCCFSIHPMKKSETHLNSFLFNTALIMLASTSISQFSYVAFRDYAYQSEASRVYGQLAFNAPVAGLFFRHNIFIWGLIVWSVVALVYLVVKPKDKRAFSSLIKAVRKKEEAPDQQQVHQQPAPKDESTAAVVEKDIEKGLGKFQSSLNVIGKLGF